MSISHRNGIVLTSISAFNGVAKASIVAIDGLLRLTGEEMRVAAEADATSASALLFYIKADRSNSWQDNGATVAATTVNDPIGRIDAVVGAQAITQGTAGLRPLLVATTTQYGWNSDGTDDSLSLSVTYFASGDDTYVIGAGIPTESAALRPMFQCGNTGSNARYPLLAVSTSDLAHASWRGDDTTLRSCDGATSVSDLPVVLTAWKSGSTKKLFVNGVQAGSTESNAVGTIATMSRSRVNAGTTGANCFLGPMALVCISKTLTTAQQVSIERYGAYLVGATYTVGL